MIMATQTYLKRSKTKRTQSQNKCKIFGQKTLSTVLKVKKKSPPNPPRDDECTWTTETTNNNQKPIPDYLKPPKLPRDGGNFGRSWRRQKGYDGGGKEVMMAAAVVCSMREMLCVFGERKK
ncbi:hypothetical protein CTI12_AA581750 [Artemisia annua]|uniref:Uncharacterized protein n=1 Tax=Artemisia annua TaxID=35608 RepID=A0A2U1KNP8_ARTAN|nr:hypothetical protein CTI12_AA581750 [Artemisia annua]